MKVKLRRTFIYEGVRYRRNSDGVEIPDDALLPSTAEVWDGNKWVERDEFFANDKRYAVAIESNKKNRQRVPVVRATEWADPSTLSQSTAALGDKVDLSQKAHGTGAVKK